MIAAATDHLLSGSPKLGRVRLGVVDGPSGSGKSTFAAAWAVDLATRVGGALLTVGDPIEVTTPAVVLLSTDHLATWADPFGWWPRLERGVLGPLAAGRPGTLGLTDWSTGVPGPGPEVAVPVPTLLVLEGVSAGRRALGVRATTTVWVEVADRANRLERAVARDGESSRLFLRAWQDDEDRHFAGDDTRLRADLIISPV